jgi:hypothetical protein
VVGKELSQKSILPVKETDSGEGVFIKELIAKGAELTKKELFEMLCAEQEGQKRFAVLILLRKLYKNTVATADDKVLVTGELLSHKVVLSQERTGKNFVRRVYQRNKLFAIEEIRSKYPEYTESDLYADLIKKRSKIKRKCNRETTRSFLCGK